jgi:hypothetical protein
VRISAANIPAPTRPANTSSAVDKAPPRQQPNAAGDSYRKNVSQAQIIDAEYVDFYSPSSSLFNQERQTLDNTLEPGKNHIELSAAGRSISPPQKYQTAIHEAPPPGTYVDIFA